MDNLIVNANGYENIRYESPESQIYVKKARLSAFANYAALSHWHEEFEFIVVLSGEMNYNVNGEIVKLTSGNGIMVNARAIHYGFSPDRTECEFLCLLIHPLLLAATTRIESRYIKPLVTNAELPYLPLDRRVNWQNEALSVLENAYARYAEDRNDLLLMADFYRLWALICANAPQRRDEAPQSSGDVASLREMLTYIRNNYEENITLGDIAAAGRVCVSKCCRIFGSLLHTSPNSYLIDYRLHKSAELLKGTDLNVTEVANKCGFANSSYFAKTFRLRIGCSPTDYKRQKNGDE